MRLVLITLVWLASSLLWAATTLVFEAEKVSRVEVVGFTVRKMLEDPAGPASGNYVLAVPRQEWQAHHERAKVAFSLHIPRAGIYYLWMRTRWSYAIDNNDRGQFFNRVSVVIDGQKDIPQLVGNDTTYHVLHWVPLNGRDGSQHLMPVTLKKGLVTLTVEAQPEGGVVLDELLLTTDAAFRPAGAIPPTVTVEKPVLQPPMGKTIASSLLPRLDEPALALVESLGNPAADDRVLRRLLGLNRERLLGVLAYTLLFDLHLHCSFRVIHDNITDTRLAPYLWHWPNKANGPELIEALALAKQLPDHSLLRPVIYAARRDKYITVRYYDDAEGRATFRYDSVLMRAAEAAYAISGGKIGVRADDGATVPEGEAREAMIRKWEEWADAQSIH